MSIFLVEHKDQPIQKKNHCDFDIDDNVEATTIKITT